MSTTGAAPATVAELLPKATEYLAAKGVESPRLDAEHLLAKALCLSRLELYMHHDRPVTDREREGFRELVRRRGEREPLAYVLGEWDFRRLTLKVDRRALVPRPETEVVVERCLELLRGMDAPEVLDVGVGTGAIALALAHEHPGSRVRGIDVSADAVTLARENAEQTGVDVTFQQQDLTTGFGVDAYDLVVSNPPYVSSDEIDTLEPEVRDWEPRIATVGDTHTRDVARHALAALRPGRRLVLEVAAMRAREAAAVLGELGYDDVRVTTDLAGRERVVDGVRP